MPSLQRGKTKPIGHGGQKKACGQNESPSSHYVAEFRASEPDTPPFTSLIYQKAEYRH
jgi:hypothetical protein